ncbi:hypothetical protein TOPH_05119 [Tolypocladium ophioglossoides CBS 100239]|uniref:FAM192A/Fyv6 N-terminal domain-containing protein n=1 Tax=Tolypocladium ophioglossoides (strain CBS 100239) TaxID=1163406 RepID=A0A0L0N808_TOLOC|nr:hypothetical protein TOPH_05119 [Tolypocladium ophioglossoides CBS 100239]
MASRFVSGGTIRSGGEVSTDETASTSQPPASAPEQPPLGKSTEWEAVQQELEAERKRRDEARLKAATGEEKSLYDVLQANKAAKQAAIEEQNRLKNQFRALDNDEVEFLDEVRERERREEERVRRETEDGLRAFRERQKGGGGGSEAVLEVGERLEVEEQWGVGRKRKRGGRERDVKGVRRRVSDAGGVKHAGDDDKEPRNAREVKKPEQVAETLKEEPKEKKVSVLVDYGSDSDD